LEFRRKGKRKREDNISRSKKSLSCEGGGKAQIKRQTYLFEEERRRAQVPKIYADEGEKVPFLTHERGEAFCKGRNEETGTPPTSSPEKNTHEELPDPLLDLFWKGGKGLGFGGQ